jgi:hypothetical protein
MSREMTREQYHNMLAELDGDALRGIINRVHITHAHTRAMTEEYLANLKDPERSRMYVEADALSLRPLLLFGSVQSD